MTDFSSAFITTITGLIGVVIGASISNYVNHQIARQTSKKDTLFKKRLEYFEKIVDTVIKNTQMYTKALKRLESSPNKKQIKEILRNIKEERMKFEIMSSPLYFDTRVISNLINDFVNIEKEVFLDLEKIYKQGISEELVSALKEILSRLNKAGYKIIIDLRTDVSKR